MAFSFQGWKVPSGYLKILHVILGAICVGIVGYCGRENHGQAVFFGNAFFFFMLVTYSCLITSFILMIAYLEESTVEKMKNSFFENFYHALSCIFYIAATIAATLIVSKEPSYARKGELYAARIVAIICAAINSFLYFLNAFIALKSQ